MCIHRRAILAAFSCGLSLFRTSLTSAESAIAQVTGITEWPAFTPLETLRLAAYHALVAHAEGLAQFETFVTGRLGVSVLVLGTTLYFGVPLCIRWRRGKGDLSLRLVFPDAIDGQFEVRLLRRNRRKARTAAARVDPTLARNARHTRHSVQRETQFEGIAPGLWFLRIEGALHARKSQARLAQISEEIEVEIRPNACATIEHTMPAAAAPVEFRVHWDGQPARDVGLSFSGQPDTLRYAGQGKIKTRLAPGAYRVIIGSGDRVVEQPLTIAGFDPHLFQIDLAAPEGLVFRGCPPALTPYLQGDLNQAARALERDGQSDVAALLRARLHQAQGQTERAAEELENAGRAREAAELRREISDFERAARLFEEAGELESAAQSHEAAENWPAAARIYMQLRNWGEAARSFEAAGDPSGVIDALENQGSLLGAAELASEQGDRARSIRLLQKIGPQSVDFGPAGRLLAKAYEHEGHLDLAAQQLERCLGERAPGDFAPDLEIHLSELLDASGNPARALEVLEVLRDRDPTYPGVASRIEALRKKLTGPPRGSEASPAIAPAGATIFVAQDRYEVLAEIGRGGMGLVYKARDRRLGRIVALKRMPETLRDHPKAVQLFLGEAQAAARMNHPNIVTLYDADQENGSFFITMELLEGLPLNTILERRGRFGPRDAARLGVQVCAGLGFAHDQGIVHRDIKTSNLFITREKVLKIMDFGLAKILEAVRDDRATVIAGTPFYMAPEQTAGNVSDGRTDLYALGVTLYELSTGRLPFSEGDVAGQHRNTPPVDPRRFVPDYPAELAELVLRLLAKRPEDRPDSAAEVARALTAFIDGSPLTASGARPSAAPPA